MTPEQFITRWQHASGSELANAQSFVRELAELLGEPSPNPAREDTRDNDYVFERRVIFRHGDGASSEGRIDCYKRGHFVLEAKKLKLGAQTKGYDDAMLRARAQAENYARALPAGEGRPPFLITVDVGNIIENGRIKVTDRPGIGLELNEEVAKKYQYPSTTWFE